MSTCSPENLIPENRCAVYLRVDGGSSTRLLGSGISELLGARDDVPSAVEWGPFDSACHPDDQQQFPTRDPASPAGREPDWDIYQLRFRDAAERWTTLRFHETDVASTERGRIRIGAAVRLEQGPAFARNCLSLGKGWRTLASRLPVMIAQLDSSAVPIYANHLAELVFASSVATSEWRAVCGPIESHHLREIVLEVSNESLSTGNAVSRVIKHGDAEIWAALHCVPTGLSHGNVLLVGHLFRPCMPGTRTGVRHGLSELLFAAALDPVIVADAMTGQLLDANPAATVVYGWPREKLLQLRWDDLIADAGEPSIMQRTPPEPGVTLGRHRRRGGGSFPVEARENTVMLQGRSIVISTIRDITERVTAEHAQIELEARLQQAQKLESLGVMAGGIAHDFNNLLSGILGSIDLVNAGLAQNSELKQSVSLARECAERAAVLCDQLLAYSGRGRFVVKPVSLKALLEELRPLLEMSLVSKPRLVFEFETELPLVEIDVAQVRQVVMSLVMNAAEATRAGSGHVTVRSRMVDLSRDELSCYLMGDQLTAGNYVALEVIDDGCGMDHATLARIFEPFFTTKFAGRGLGLSALMGIVRGHGGAIQVVSDPGKGSLFRVLFPTQRRRLSEGVHAPAIDWHGSGCVLFADDEMPVRKVARRILERLGFQTVLAQSGRGAVDEFARCPDAFSLVILDLTMPEMTGEEALRHIRAIRSQVPIVLTSGYGEEEVLERLAHVRVDAFLKKPFRMEDFSSVVRSVLDRRSVSGIDFRPRDQVPSMVTAHTRAQGDR